MAVSYDKLWKLLIDKKMNKTQLCESIFSVPESWGTDTGQNAFSESYFNADTVRSLLELAKLL